MALGAPLALNASQTPSLFIPGIDKGGTSEAYLALLDAAPFVEGATKEPGCLYQRDVAGCYRRSFPGGGASVDATPNYAWAYLVDAAAFARAAAPKAVSIFFLRRPAKRIRSLHNYWKADQRIGARLGAAVDAHVRVELDYLSTPASARLLGTLLGPAPTHAAYAALCRGLGPWIAAERPASCAAVTGPGSVDRGAGCPVHVPFLATTLYYALLKNWLAHYDADDVAVLESESYWRDPELLLRLFPGRAGRRRLHANEAAYRTPPLSPALEAELEAFFEAPNAALRGLLAAWPSEHARVAPDPEAPGTWWRASGRGVIKP